MPTTRGEKWRATKIDDETFLCETGVRSKQVRGAHCKCCALVTAILEHGGSANLRGLHRYGPCYQMLVVTGRAAGDEGEGD